MEVLIGNVNYRETGFNEAFLKHKAFSVIGSNSLYYRTLESILQSVVPEKWVLYGTNDFVLDNAEQSRLKREIQNTLNVLLQNKTEEPENTLGTYKVLGKNISLSLRDPDDKLLATLIKFLEITEDCLQEQKPLYFSVVKTNEQKNH